jgi:DNA-binding NarL/FixJ family response regulator
LGLVIGLVGAAGARLAEQRLAKTKPIIGAVPDETELGEGPGFVVFGTAPTTNRPRVMVVSESAEDRRRLVGALAASDLEILGEVPKGISAVERAQELMPDVVLMDLKLPSDSGIDAIRQMKEFIPHVRILVETEASWDALRAVVERGASGVLGRPVSAVALKEAVEAASRGEFRVEPRFFTEFARVLLERAKARDPHGSRLTSRESEVLLLLTTGTDTREIAAHLGVSEHVVQTHLQDIFEKLGSRPI